MGKPNAEPSDQTPTTHFSHPHPLHLQNLPPSAQTPPCSACKLDASGPVYTCAVCSFVLHPKCYQLPQQIKHPFDQNHALSLHPKPVYPEGLFSCDACGNQGDGFSYHCSPCGVDLHTTCASLPMKFTHQSHHHELSLTFSAPYPGNKFSCDVCKRAGSRTWIYRCCTCEFDVHLTCVATVIQPAPKISTMRSAIPSQPSSGVFMNPTNTGVYGAPVLQPVVMGVQPQGQFLATPYNNISQPAAYGSARPVNGGGLTDQLAVAAVNGMASGVAQSTTQAILQGFFGGGGGAGGGGGSVSYVDVVGMGGGGGITDGGAYYDGGYGGTDGGYSAGDSSY